MLNFWIEVKIQTQDSRHLLKNRNHLDVHMRREEKCAILKARERMNTLP